MHLSTSFRNETHADNDLPENTNVVNDVEFLVLASFHFKFPLIPFSSFREKVENASANKSLGRSS